MRVKEDKQYPNEESAQDPNELIHDLVSLSYLMIHIKVQLSSCFLVLWLWLLTENW